MLIGTCLKLQSQSHLMRIYLDSIYSINKNKNKKIENDFLRIPILRIGMEVETQLDLFTVNRTVDMLKAQVTGSVGSHLVFMCIPG